MILFITGIICNLGLVLGSSYSFKDVLITMFIKHDGFRAKACAVHLKFTLSRIVFPALRSKDR